jgi:hypothetical protein
MFTVQDAIAILTGNDAIPSERFSSEVASIKAITADDVLKMFPGVTIAQSPHVIYFPVEMCHTWPLVNKRGKTFTAKTLARSCASANQQLINLEHQLVDNDIGVKKDEIIGSIVATHFPASKEIAIADGISLVPAKPIPLYALGMLFMRHSKVPRIVESHLSGDSAWTVSMECAHNWKDAAVIYDGRFTPFIETPVEILEQLSNNVYNYRGKEIAVALGGIDGKVDFWGLGMTTNPADPESHILNFFAGVPREVASMGAKTVFNIGFTDLGKKSEKPNFAEIASQAVDMRFKELASVEIVGSTEPSEDGHTHEVLSDGTILPIGGHGHYIKNYGLVTGGKPRLTGVTDNGYLRPANPYPSNGTYGGLSGEVVHCHLINIDLAKKYRRSSETASDQHLQSASFLEITGEDEMKLNGVFDKLEALVGKLNSVNPTGVTAAGSPISGELASLVNEIRQAKADDEVGKAIADGVAKELASGKYVSKEKADADIKAAVDAKEADLTTKHEAEKAATAKLQQRLADAAAIGVDLDGNYDGEDLTVRKHIESIPLTEAGDAEFARAVRTLKQIVAAAKAVVTPASATPAAAAAAAAAPAQVASAPARKPLVLVGGGPSAAAAAASDAAASAAANAGKPRIGKHAITCVQ